MKEMAISKELGKKLRNEAADAEKLGSLTVKQLEIIYQQKWFKLFVPKEFGGLALTLPEGLKLEESLAELDGSLGWTVTLCSGATMFIGYLDRDIVKILFGDEKVCFGGSGRASGKAKIIPDGYVVSGEWQYATGATHNTVFTANCELIENNQPIVSADGSPRIKSFLFLKEDVELFNDWDMMGLKATASNSFAVKELMVKKSHAFEINTLYTTCDNPIYRYPFKQFAETTLAVNILGMTKRFLELANRILAGKKADSTKLKRAQIEAQNELFFTASAALYKIKDSFYAQIENSWTQLEKNEFIEGNLLGVISQTSHNLVKESLKLVSQLYPYCGMLAARPNEEINRVWRNIFTASQHSIFL